MYRRYTNIGINEIWDGYSTVPYTPDSLSVIIILD